MNGLLWRMDLRSSSDPMLFTVGPAVSDCSNSRQTEMPNDVSADPREFSQFTCRAQTLSSPRTLVVPVTPPDTRLAVPRPLQPLWFLPASLTDRKLGRMLKYVECREFAARTFPKLHSRPVWSLRLNITRSRYRPSKAGRSSDRRAGAPS
jgi:hypothetical protein